MKVALVAIAVLFAAFTVWAIVRSQQAPGVLTCSTVGVSLTMPAGWTTLPDGKAPEKLSGNRLSDRKLTKLLEKNNGAISLTFFHKYEEPYPTLNPTVVLIAYLIPKEHDHSPETWLNGGAEAMRSRYPDFTFVEPIQVTEVAGHRAARAGWTLSESGANGQRSTELTRRYVVVRGDIAIDIMMGSPAEGADMCEAEFGQVLASVEIVE